MRNHDHPNRQVALTEVPCDADDLGPVAIGALALPVQRSVLQQRAGQARRVAVELVGPLHTAMMVLERDRLLAAKSGKGHHRTVGESLTLIHMSSCFWHENVSDSPLLTSMTPSPG